MKTSDFHYHLPKHLIASEPLKERSASRLMVLERDGQIRHKRFTDLPDLLSPGDLLVFNNSKVIPARLYAAKPTGGKVEILIERIIDDLTAFAHVKGAKSLKEGSKVFLSSAEFGEAALGIGVRRNDLLTLHTDENWHEVLERYGNIPLPPYMEREDRAEDKDRYQTVYADEEKKGSVAAPTAGLHFDEPLLARLREKGIQTAFVTLHVGAGTFQPVRVEDVSEHKMHSERYEITREVMEMIHQTKENAGRVVAVGTTSVRVLESVYARITDDQMIRTSETVTPHSDHRLIRTSETLSGETDIFITPGFAFQAVDALITNFHLPESTLMMLVSAFSGREHIMNAYEAAVAENYRFFSYGDAMLLL